MAPLYPPGLDENGAVAILYPTSWICSGNGAPSGTIDLTPWRANCTMLSTIFFPLAKSMTAWYNFFPQHLGVDILVPGTIFFPDS